jgi:hypothetical protein
MWSLLVERTLNLARRITSSPRLRRHEYRGVVHVTAHDPDAVRRARSGFLVVQMKGERPTWLVMACPCRCAEILRVNLMTSIHPHWDLTQNERGLTADPSLDVRSCGSHFWLRDSRVHWV